MMMVIPENTFDTYVLSLWYNAKRNIIFVNIFCRRVFVYFPFRLPRNVVFTLVYAYL
jgi:hypothetical protein